MLFTNFSVTGALLLYPAIFTLADELGCYTKGERFSDIFLNGDMTDSIKQFCEYRGGSYEYGRLVELCLYTDANDRRVDFEIKFGDYPNHPNSLENITFSKDTCLTVLNHALDQCGPQGGKVEVSYTNGNFSDGPVSSKRRGSRKQFIDKNKEDPFHGQKGNQAECGNNASEEDPPVAARPEAIPSGASTITSTTTAVTIITSTVNPAPTSVVTSFVTVTKTGKKHRTSKGGKQDPVMRLSTKTITTTSSTSSSLVSSLSSSSISSPSSSSSPTNTDEFHGFVKIDPNKGGCPNHS